MLMPFMGFVAGVFVFSILGAILLAALPQFRLRPLTLTTFVVAAMPCALAAGYVYGQFFADSDGRLTTLASIVGLFLALGIGGSFGGLAASRAACRLTSR